MFSANEIREYGNLANNEVNDIILLLMEKKVVSLVENETGSYFGPVKEEISLISGTGKNHLWLPHRVTGGSPGNLTSFRYAVQNNRSILSADTIFNNNFDSVIDFSQEIDVEWRSIQLTNIALKFDRKVIRIGNVWPTRDYIVEATYNIGYAAGEEPDDIKMIVMSAIGLLVTSKGKEGLLRLDDQNTRAFFSYASKNVPFWDETIANHSLKLAFAS